LMKVVFTFYYYVLVFCTYILLLLFLLFLCLFVYSFLFNFASITIPKFLCTRHYFIILFYFTLCYYIILYYIILYYKELSENKQLTAEEKSKALKKLIDQFLIEQPDLIENDSLYHDLYKQLSAQIKSN
jgi:predicted membrane protein